MPEEFIKSLEPFCAYIKERGYFPSVFLAQSALESGWGSSPLVTFQNYWGHKWKPETDIGVYNYCSKVSNEEANDSMVPVNSRFRIYPDMQTAVKAYCDKWEECWPNGEQKYPNPNFASPAGFIMSVAPIYATDSKYVKKINELIDEWGLQQYD